MDRETARIIDANFNRAREALRVMEDYTRFVLDDPASCEILKRCRHDLTAITRELPEADLLASRDTPGDVGTQLSTDAEQHRPDMQAVFAAAAKRLPEALRTLEEYSKTIDRSLAGRYEALRYAAYDLEQRVVCRGSRSARFARVRLYVIISSALCRNDWLATAQQAIEGGADCLQLREKSLEDGELLQRARSLVRLCREHDAVCVINDRPDVAVLADADGVHLGQTDLPLPEARRIAGPTRLIGLCTHDSALRASAVAAAPDYIAVGPMFPSTTKPQDHVPGPALLAEAERLTDIPIVPIGGITPKNAGILKETGAQRLCVCSAVLAANDVRSATAALQE